MAFSPLQTRVGRRITLLFIVSALLPILVLAIVGYVQVRAQLIAQGRADLEQSVRNVGMGIIDQLRAARAALEQAGEAPAGQPGAALRRHLATIFDSIAIGTPRQPADTLVSITLGDGQPAPVWLRVYAPDGRTLTARLRREHLYFGASDRAGSTASRTSVCIREMPGGRPVLCPDSGALAGDVLTAEWEMFLGYEYHAPPWLVTLARPTAELLAPVGAFRRTFFASLLLVLGLVLLLSSRQVRRSLQPLIELRRGTERLTARDFGTPVVVRSRDEFEDLAGSFNAMASEIQHQMQRLQELSWGALSALARTIDASSSWTAGHSDRVTSLALRMAVRGGCSPEELDTLRRGGLLHDIGKIGIEPRIIDKAGLLDPEELRRIREHPELGARILAPLAAFAAAIPIVLHHHEKVDGTGYPHGLKGDEIPPLARLLAVADVYDALVSARPYRAGWPQELAIQTIRESAGSHFDPAYVKLFLEVMAEEGDAARFAASMQESAA